MEETVLTTAIKKLQDEMKGWTSDINVFAAYHRNIEFLISMLPKEREDIEKAHLAGLISNDVIGSQEVMYFNTTFTQYKPVNNE